MRVETYRTNDVIVGGAAEALWQIYAAAFDAGETTSVQYQLCYRHDEFLAALADPTMMKYVAEADGLPVGLVISTNVPEKAAVAYVSPRYLRARFPQEVAEGRLWYFTAIAVAPHAQGSKAVFGKLIAEITRFIDATNGVVLFDTSDESPPVAEMIRRATLAAQASAPHRTDHTEVSRLGGQSYWLLELSTKAP